MQNILREKYFDIVSIKVKKILAMFLEFCSKWLRLITCAKLSHVCGLVVLTVKTIIFAYK